MIDIPLVEYLGYFWLIVGIFLLLLEVGTPGLFFFVSLAMGSFIAAIAAFLNFSWYVQCWTAIGGALLSFGILKYFFANKKKSNIKTNIDALIGKEGVVIETIEPRKIGRIKIKGEEWPAISDHQVILQKGTVVKVVRIDGNKLVVI
jgi:membrane protein implicated in regulation of membrane protease activity